MIEVMLLENENVIKESLHRIGIANKSERVLYPTCHLYEKDNKFFIAHFKEMFMETRENSYNNISVEDIKRRNSIVKLLMDWKLIDVEDKSIIKEEDNVFVYVLKHKDKHEWAIRPKFKFMEN